MLFEKKSTDDVPWQERFQSMTRLCRCSVTLNSSALFGNWKWGHKISHWCCPITFLLSWSIRLVDSDILDMTAYVNCPSFCVEREEKKEYSYVNCNFQLPGITIFVTHKATVHQKQLVDSHKQLLVQWYSWSTRTPEVPQTTLLMSGFFGPESTRIIN